MHRVLQSKVGDPVGLVGEERCLGVGRIRECPGQCDVSLVIKDAKEYLIVSQL